MQNIDEFKDFFLKEINNLENCEIDDENICLITKEPLEHNAIKLTCNHSFNYISLYNEVYNQKIEKKKIDCIQLAINQFKCPYCRTIQNKLLPYFPNNQVQKIRGVNSPIKYSMYLSTCKYILKSGPNKGKLCNKECNFDYCTRHKNIVEKHNNGCQHVLLKGKHKGQKCLRKIKENELCSVHLK